MSEVIRTIDARDPAQVEVLMVAAAWPLSPLSRMCLESGAEKK